MEKLTEYGPIGIVALVAFSAAGVLWRDNKRLEKEKFDLAMDVKDNVTLTIKSVNDTMKAILIAVEQEVDEHKHNDKENTQHVQTLTN